MANYLNRNKYLNIIYKHGIECNKSNIKKIGHDGKLIWYL